jgi:hypothetical protein
MIKNTRLIASHYRSFYYSIFSGTGIYGNTTNLESIFEKLSYSVIFVKSILETTGIMFALSTIITGEFLTANIK